jgi:hypothetical protein
MLKCLPALVSVTYYHTRRSFGPLAETLIFSQCFGVRKLACALKSGSKLPHSKAPVALRRWEKSPHGPKDGLVAQASCLPKMQAGSLRYVPRNRI